MIALFVLKLLTGITLMWWLMPRREVTDGFFRIQMRVVLGLAVLTALMIRQGNAESVGSNAVMVTGLIRVLAIGIALVSYAGSVFWALGRRRPGNICIHLLTAASVIALGLYGWYMHRPGNLLQQMLSDFSTALVSGSVLTGMLLGHWYLTTPTMSIQPLWWFNRAIAVAAILRLVASGWAIAVSGVPEPDMTQQIWLAIRWLGGIVSPLAMTYLVWTILKYRNTQSATGVMFACLILVFMGEMTAALLERATMIPY